MARPKQKEVMGVPLSSLDGIVWNWTLDSVAYAWCKMGWLLRQENGAQIRIMFSRTIEGAVGYTCGLHDGVNYAQRGRPVPQWGKEVKEGE